MADRPYASGVSRRAIKRLRRKEMRREETLEASKDVKPLATDPTEASNVIKMQSLRNECSNGVRQSGLGSADHE